MACLQLQRKLAITSVAHGAFKLGCIQQRLIWDFHSVATRPINAALRARRADYGRRGGQLLRRLHHQSSAQNVPCTDVCTRSDWRNSQGKSVSYIKLAEYRVKTTIWSVLSTPSLLSLSIVVQSKHRAMSQWGTIYGAKIDSIKHIQMNILSCCAIVQTITSSWH
eukprot:4274338-Pleurochrysis_carterae.AAC.5